MEGCKGVVFFSITLKILHSGTSIIWRKSTEVIKEYLNLFNFLKSHMELSATNHYSELTVSLQCYAVAKSANAFFLLLRELVHKK